MRDGRVSDGSAGAGACVEERGTAAAAAVAGRCGNGLGVWDGEDELPGAALAGVGRVAPVATRSVARTPLRGRH